jgi:hypothetical protein
LIWYLFSVIFVLPSTAKTFVPLLSFLFQQFRSFPQERSLEYYEDKEVVQQNPKNPRAHYEFALIAAARGPEKAVTKAIAWLEPVIHELKEFFEPNALMGLLYAQVFQTAPGRGKPEALTLAIKHLEYALALVRDSRSTPYGF